MLFGTIQGGERGMFASLRTYRIGSGSVDAVMRRVDREFAEALSQEPGFVAYHAIDTGNDMVMPICRDRGLAEPSTTRNESSCAIPFACPEPRTSGASRCRSSREGAARA